MKKFFVLFLMGAAVVASAQVKKPVAKPAAKPTVKPAAPKTPTAPVLKNLNDSASYAIGLSVVNFYKHQGITNLNTAMITRAINDVTGNKTVLLSDDQANAVMMKMINQKQEAKAATAISAGQKFLQENKTKPGVQTTASGLQYEVLREGHGPKPSLNDTVEVNYMGTLIDGTEFDNSYKRGQSISFPVTGVIKGWTEALQLMPAGAKYKLYIPHELAYGTSDVGSIPAGSTLIFEVELIKVAGKQ
jgi:FKBP-type peptidyl-prolyl cis-trans isomerase FklB